MSALIIGVDLGATQFELARRMIGSSFKSAADWIGSDSPNFAASCLRV